MDDGEASNNDGVAGVGGSASWVCKLVFSRGETATLGTSDRSPAIGSGGKTM